MKLEFVVDVDDAAVVIVVIAGVVVQLFVVSTNLTLQTGPVATVKRRRSANIQILSQVERPSTSLTTLTTSTTNERVLDKTQNR